MFRVCTVYLACRLALWKYLTGEDGTRTLSSRPQVNLANQKCSVSSYQISSYQSAESSQLCEPYDTLLPTHASAMPKYLKVPWSITCTQSLLLGLALVLSQFHAGSPFSCYRAAHTLGLCEVVIKSVGKASAACLTCMQYAV